jgi:hypothetical protein
MPPKKKSAPAREPSAAARVKAAKTVYVHVSGTPRSVAALLWTLQQGRLDAKVVYTPTLCGSSGSVRTVLSPVTRSYVQALAKAYDLKYSEGWEAGPGIEHVQGNSIPTTAYLTPFADRGEADAFALLDQAHVRPHPGVTLGVKNICADVELKKAAKKKQVGFERALAAAAVLSGSFPEDFALFDEGEHRERTFSSWSHLVENGTPYPHKTAPKLWERFGSPGTYMCSWCGRTKGDTSSPPPTDLEGKRIDCPLCPARDGAPPAEVERDEDTEWPVHGPWTKAQEAQRQILRTVLDEERKKQARRPAKTPSEDDPKTWLRPPQSAEARAEWQAGYDRREAEREAEAARFAEKGRRAPSAVAPASPRVMREEAARQARAEKKAGKAPKTAEKAFPPVRVLYRYTKRRDRVLALPKGVMLLFSYGSNSPEQLEERLGRKVDAIRGYVANMRRAFVGHSKTWGGATATLEPAEGETTFGSLVAVTEADLKKLDVYEGAPRVYRRVMIPVVSPDWDGSPAENVTAVVYLATSTDHGKPTAAYEKAIEKNLRAVWGETDEERRRAAPIPRHPFYTGEYQDEIARRVAKRSRADAFEQALAADVREREASGGVDYSVWIKLAKNNGEALDVVKHIHDELHRLLKSAWPSDASMPLPSTSGDRDAQEGRSRWRVMLKGVSGTKEGARIREIGRQWAIIDKERKHKRFTKAGDETRREERRVDTWAEDKDSYQRKVEDLGDRTDDFVALMHEAKDAVDAETVLQAWGHALLEAFGGELPKYEDQRGRAIHQTPKSDRDKKATAKGSFVVLGALDEYVRGGMPTWKAAIAKLPADKQKRARSLLEQYPKLLDAPELDTNLHEAGRR